MKICELEIDSYNDRAELVRILVFAGYKVSVEEKKLKNRYDSAHFVIVEDDDDER